MSSLPFGRLSTSNLLSTAAVDLDVVRSNHQIQPMRNVDRVRRACENKFSGSFFLSEIAARRQKRLRVHLPICVETYALVYHNFTRSLANCTLSETQL